MNNPYFYQQPNVQRIDNQIRELESLKTQFQSLPQQQPITQNFQLAPSQSNNNIKYMNSVEDVKNELVFTDTLFINKEHTKLWLKNSLGDIKSFEIKEIIEKDEKDLKIDELMAKINQLESEMKKSEPSSNDDANVDATTTN